LTVPKSGLEIIQAIFRIYSQKADFDFNLSHKDQ